MKASEDNQYFKVHAWLIYYYGSATRCEGSECTHTNPKRFEWALIKGKSMTKNRANFIMLCPSCHRKYDYTEDQKAKMILAKKGVPAKNKRHVILNDSQTFESITQASSQTGCKVSSIANNLKGLSRKTKVGTWEYAHLN